MRPCKNDRLHQQHKLYEQARRSQITSLISSLHQCLPLEFKPAKDNQTEILSSVLLYIQFLKETQQTDPVVQDKNIGNVEKRKAYVSELEERCERYGKLLDAAGIERTKVVKPNDMALESRSIDNSQLKLPLSGPVSVIAASAPLVLFVSQQPQESSKTYINRSTSSSQTDAPATSSISPNVFSTTTLYQDASTVTDGNMTNNESTQTDLGTSHFQTVGIQVGTYEYHDQASSPVALLSTEGSSSKRSFAEFSLSENTSKSKRRRSDHTAPTISEIVNLVAANSLEQVRTSGADMSGSGDRRSVSEMNDHNVLSSAQETMTTSADRHGVQILGAAYVESTSVPMTQAESVLTNNNQSNPIPAISSNSTTWRNVSSVNHDTTSVSGPTAQQPHRIHPEMSSTFHQLHFSPNSGTRHPAPVTHTVQRNSAETDEGSYTTTAANQTRSRRGVNFSVEFLHGNTQSTTTRPIQQEVHNQQRQISQPASTISSRQTRRSETQQQMHNSMNYGYYEQERHATYGNMSNNFSSNYQWSSDPNSYQWWTGPQSSNGISATASSGQPSRSGGNNLNTSQNGTKDQSGTVGNSPAVNVTEPSMGNLGNYSNSGNHGSSIFVSSCAYTVTTNASLSTTWSNSSQGYYTSSSGLASSFTPIMEPANFNNVRQRSVRTATSSALSAVSNNNITSTANYTYSPYWSCGDWTSSTFSSGALSSSNFNVNDNSINQSSNNGKTQNFQIASMIPEAVSSNSTAGTGPWIGGDIFQHPSLNGRSDFMFETSRSTTTSSSYVLQPPSYHQATSNLSGTTSRYL